MNGYVKLYRATLENPIVCKSSDHFAIWGYLLLKATHDSFETIFNGKKITLKSGQLITGRKAISDHFGINESKVERVFRLLENEHMIEQQTCTKNRLITILNWDIYQEANNEVNNKRTTSEQQVNTDKNVKNDNNTERLKDNKKDTVRFVKPKRDEIINYIKLENLNVDVDVFIDHYESNGWKVGKSPMKSWEATLRNWSRKNNNFEQPKKQFQKKGRVEQLTVYDDNELIENGNKMTIKENNEIIETFRRL